MIKALVLTNMYPYEKVPFYGSVVKEEVDYLRQKGIEVDVLFINGRENRWNYFKGLSRLARILVSKKFDVIHTHHTYCAYMAFIGMLRLKHKIPVVLTLHEGEIFHNGNQHYAMDIIEKLKYVRSIKNFAIKKVDYLITVYEGLMENINKSESSLVPCGVNMNLFKPLPKDECRKKLNIDKDAKVIFFPSDYRRPEKRFDLVKKAYWLLKGFYKKNLHLLHGGDIPYVQMSEYLNASDVVVLASDYEASPMIIKEAMATNIPIVSVDVGDVKKVLAGLEGCFITNQEYWNIATSLKKALDFNKRTNGRLRIQELDLSIEKTASKITKIYEEIISYN